MAGSFTQSYQHLVFAVKYRNALIDPSWEARLYNYIAGILQEHKHRCISINGTTDHIHILLALHGEQGYSDMVRNVKGSSSRWLNQEKLPKSKFAWQAGYGLFSVDGGNMQRLLEYIANQKEHHKKVSFQEEYRLLLKRNGIEFQDDWLFEDPE